MKKHHKNESFTRDADQKIYQRNAGSMSPSTLDTANRRVRSVLTTEDPVPIWDWRTGEVVDEVLVVAGCKSEPQTPMLRDHNQYLVTAIIGSVTEVSSTGDELNGLLEFGKQLDDTSEAIWRRVEQGHLRRGSIGYYYEKTDYETIDAGKSRLINGKTYTARKERAMRVVTNWRLVEYSMVVIPADPRAQMKSSSGTQGTDQESNQESSSSNAIAPSRNHSPEDEMKKFLRFLHQNGLAASVTDETAALEWARSGNLSSDLLDQLAELTRAENVQFDRESAKAKASNTQTEQTRSGNTTTTSTQTTSESVDTRTAAEQAVAQERSRIAAIRSLHRDHPEVAADVVEQAICDGWDLGRAQSEFLTAIRNSRTAGAPAVHTRSSSQINRRVLQAALMSRSGIDPDAPVLRSLQAQSLVGRRRELDLGWAVGTGSTGQRRDELEQAFEIVNQRGLRGASFMRLAELCCELSHPGERFFNDDEIFERAFSSGDFSAVFGAVVHMELLASYMKTPTVYDQFCEVREVGDFRAHKTNDMGQVGRLKKMGRNGGTAALLNMEDMLETTITVERYAGQLVVDDQTLINDTFGVSDMLPAELGETCRCMADDLAFSQVLLTSNLSDSRARFNTTDGNSISSASLGDTSLTALGVALKAKAVGDRRIEVGQAVLLAGTTLAPTARTWMSSQRMADNLDNPHMGTYRVIEDTAIDLGVKNPANDDAAVAGTPSAVYAFTTGAKRSIVFAWRRGTGRGPVTGPAINLSNVTTGQWGLAWKTYMDMGAAFQRRVGAVKLSITG